jgi:hypothetical protein
VTSHNLLCSYDLPIFFPAVCGKRSFIGLAQPLNSEGVPNGTIPAVGAFHAHRNVQQCPNPSEVLIRSIDFGKTTSAGTVPPGGSRGPSGRNGCSNGRVSRPSLLSGKIRRPGRSSGRSDSSSENKQPPANPRKGGPCRENHLGSGKRNGRRRLKFRKKFLRRWEWGTK